MRAFAEYAAGCGVPQVIFTMGIRGSCGISRGAFWQGRAYPVRAVDALGAGDAFIAAFLTDFYCNGGDAPAAADRAAHFAADCCLHYGAFGHPLPLEQGGALLEV